MVVKIGKEGGRTVELVFGSDQKSGSRERSRELAHGTGVETEDLKM